jgi:hypothetical protein
MTHLPFRPTNRCSSLRRGRPAGRGVRDGHWQRAEAGPPPPAAAAYAIRRTGVRRSRCPRDVDPKREPPLPSMLPAGATETVTEVA